jgi:hypothetical protein
MDDSTSPLVHCYEMRKCLYHAWMGFQCGNLRLRSLIGWRNIPAGPSDGQIENFALGDQHDHEKPNLELRLSTFNILRQTLTTPADSEFVYYHVTFHRDRKRHPSGLHSHIAATASLQGPLYWAHSEAQLHHIQVDRRLLPLSRDEEGRHSAARSWPRTSVESLDQKQGGSRVRYSNPHHMFFHADHLLEVLLVRRVVNEVGIHCL